MRKHILGSVLVVGLFSLSALPVRAGENYKIDPIHSSISFKIQHSGISWVHGRFNAFNGSYSVDKDDPSKSTFEISIKPESVDTNNTGRDTHLKGGDFFNVKQFPALSFKSTAVKAVDGGLEVTGDLTMHGETKPITFTLKGGKEAPPGRGPARTGFSTDLSLKRSDFGMTKFLEMLSDEIQISVSFQGAKQR
jgi:polyisoprenoid-binding protein YceI